MEDSKKLREAEQEGKEITDQELENVSGGFLRKVESKRPPQSSAGDGSETEG